MSAAHPPSHLDAPRATGARTAGASERGFSLIDLALVLAIISILSAMAISRFGATAARAKRVEARVALSAIWRAQKAEQMRTGAYAGTFQKLGFSLDGQVVLSPTQIKGKNYTFTISRPWGPRSFYAVAEGNLDRDPMTDLLVIFEAPPP